MRVVGKDVGKWNLTGEGIWRNIYPNYQPSLNRQYFNSLVIVLKNSDDSTTCHYILNPIICDHSATQWKASFTPGGRSQCHESSATMYPAHQCYIASVWVWELFPTSKLPPFLLVVLLLKTNIGKSKVWFFIHLFSFRLQGRDVYSKEEFHNKNILLRSASTSLAAEWLVQWLLIEKIAHHWSTRSDHVRAPA